MLSDREGYLYKFIGSKDNLDIYEFENNYEVRVYQGKDKAYIDFSFKNKYYETKSFDAIKKLKTILNIMDKYNISEWYICSIGKKLKFYVNLFEHIGYTVTNKKHYIILKKN